MFKFWLQQAEISTLKHRIPSDGVNSKIFAFFEISAQMLLKKLCFRFLLQSRSEHTNKNLEITAKLFSFFGRCKKYLVCKILERQNALWKFYVWSNDFVPAFFFFFCSANVTFKSMKQLRTQIVCVEKYFFFEGVRGKNFLSPRAARAVKL